MRFMKKLAGNSLQEAGCQLTHFATRGELKQVERLLSDGTNPNGAQDGLSEPTLVPLVAAARFGNCEMVRVMIDHGAEPIRTEHPNDHTFLHAAAQHGNFQVCKKWFGTFPFSALGKRAKKGCNFNWK